MISVELCKSYLLNSIMGQDKKASQIQSLDSNRDQTDGLRLLATMIAKQIIAHKSSDKGTNNENLSGS